MPSQLDVDKIRNTSAVDTLTIDASGNTTLGGNLVLPSTKTIKNENNNNVVSVTSGGNVTVGGAGTVTVGGSGDVSLGTGSVSLGGGSGAVTLGGSGNLVLSGSGIDFGTGTDGSGTVTGGVLDDYETGSFTATFTGTTHTATGYYTKIGRTVYAYVYSSAMNVTSSVRAIIGGLPFTSNVGYAAGNITHNNYATNSENGYVQSGETNFYIVSNNSISTNYTVVGNQKYVMMAVFYFTNA